MMNENEFRQYLKAKKGCADSSINAYVSDIKDFEAFLTGVSKALVSCSAEDIKNFLIYLKDRGFSSSTLNRRAVSIRKYFEYLRESGICTNNPCLSVKMPAADKKAPDYLSLEDIEKLLNAPANDEKGIRDKAILELLYACGLKVSELTQLNVRDIDLRIGFVSCRGSGSKNRIIPMGHLARQALLNYMKETRQKILGQAKDSGALFLNYTGERITRQGVWKLIKYYGKKSGISDNLNPQLIRNSFTAHMILNGADLKSIQELLGNADIGTVQMFLTLSKARVMDVYDKTHPRA